MHYSQSTNAFYPGDFRQDYVDAGTWPADAIEVTDSEYKKYGQGTPPAGMQRGADSDGRPTWVPKPVAAIEDRRTAAKNTIDTEAGNARTRFVSAGQLVAEEYLQAENAAQQWTDSGRPASQVPDDVQVWADASGMTPDQAADNILATAANWRTLITTIRQIRLSGKAAVDSATDQDTADDMMQVAQPFIDQLRALKP